MNYSQEDEARERINKIKNYLENMNPSEQEVHLDSIDRLLEGSASLVDIKLPKGAQTTRGRPSAASKKKNLKTEPREPSQFEKIHHKRIASEMVDQDAKKKKIQPRQKILPVRSTRKIPALPEAPQYLRHFPPMIHQYIEKILDVEADGHCGFRVIAWELGRGQDSFMDVRKEIYNDLKERSEFYLNQGFLDEVDRVARRIHVDESGPCDIDHWMSMPTTGHLMAEVYNRPVFYYGKSWSQTFFPSTTIPNGNPPFFIGLTESRHFVALKMKDENLFPAAQLEKNWEQIATPEALRWKDRYKRCFELTQRIKLETGFDKCTF